MTPASEGRIEILRGSGQSLKSHSQRRRYPVGRTSQLAGTLSGGNQQRVVIGRELDREPRLLVAAGPTRGVDVLGIEFIHSQLRALRDNGSGVLLVSEQLDELLDLSDRIVVLHGGVVAGEVPGGPESRYAVGELMLGRKPS